LTGRECQGSTLAVVGVGHIGYEVYGIGKALGMRTLGVDIDPWRNDVEYVPVERALAEADVLVCAMDLRASNRGFFDMDRWRQAKPGLIFVNVSRGELSPSTALLAALEEGLLGGVGLDVYNREAALAGALRSRTPADDDEVKATIALSQRDDCICTPHNGFNSAEAVRRKSEHSVEQIVAYLERGAFLWSPPATR
jgi:D-lactate dehydrogenase